MTQISHKYYDYFSRWYILILFQAYFIHWQWTYKLCWLHTIPSSYFSSYIPLSWEFDSVLELINYNDPLSVCNSLENNKAWSICEVSTWFSTLFALSLDEACCTSEFCTWVDFILLVVTNSGKMLNTGKCGLLSKLFIQLFT